MAAVASPQWQTLFETWPNIIARKSALVTKQGEAIPFTNFMISPGLLLVERDGPDASGNRRIMVGFDSIAMVKLAGSGELALFQSMGFQPTL